MHKFYRVLRTAVRALRRNVMRSALTTLGIIIGVSAVIAMTEIGQGSSTAVQKTTGSFIMGTWSYTEVYSDGVIEMGSGVWKVQTPRR